MEILASNPNLLSNMDEKVFRVVSNLFWKDQLSDQERHSFREAAEKESLEERAAIAALEASNPAFKQQKERIENLRKSKAAINSSNRAAAGPLGKAVLRARKGVLKLANKKPKVPLALRKVVKAKASKNLNGVKRSKEGAATLNVTVRKGPSAAAKELAATYCNTFVVISTDVSGEQRVTRSRAMEEEKKKKKKMPAVSVPKPLLRRRARK